MKTLFSTLMLACASGCSSSGFPEDFHFGTFTAGLSGNHLAGDPPTFGPLLN